MLVVGMECRLNYCGCLGNQKAACVSYTKLLFIAGNARNQEGHAQPGGDARNQGGDALP